MKAHRWSFASRKSLLACLLAALSMLAMACRRVPSSAVTTGSPPPTSASSAQSDLAFLDTMTSHHERAIRMWQTATTNATHPELRDFAHQAAEEQRREIFLMHSWRDRWFARAPAAADASSTGEEKMPVLTVPAGGAGFDEPFLAMMVQHHQRAAAMARTAASGAEIPEVRQLAQIIVNQQEEEVETMKGWQRTWFGEGGDSGKRRP